MRDAVEVAVPPSATEEFSAARPFRHVVIDDVFPRSFALELAMEMPRRSAFDAADAEGERRFDDVAPFGEAHARLLDALESQELRERLAQATGIAGLEFDRRDPDGGAILSSHGGERDPQVPANYHPVSRRHRRLQLLVFLTEHWDERWGGDLALFSDPRDPNAEVVEIAPRFNRAVLLETGERSWIAANRIRQPADRRNVALACLSFYFYSRERPEREVFPDHPIFAAPRPLPPRFRAGMRLTQADVREIAALIGHRDRLIRAYQRDLVHRSAPEISSRPIAPEVPESAHRIRISGFVSTVGPFEGRSASGWSARRLRVLVVPVRPVARLVASFAIAPGVSPSSSLAIAIDGVRVASARVGSASAIEISAATSLYRGRCVEIVASIEGDAGCESDAPAFRCDAMRFEHREGRG